MIPFPTLKGHGSKTSIWTMKDQEDLYDSLVTSARITNNWQRTDKKNEEKGNQHRVAFYNGAFIMGILEPGRYKLLNW